MTIAWDDVRFLEGIERLGNVSAAAREFGLSVSTLYRRITELETALGQLCLARGPNGGLTDTGRAVVAVGRRTRQGLAEVTARLRAESTELEGEVTLTTVSALLPFLEQPIAQLTEQHPRLQLSVHLGDTGPSVRNREVDLALGVMHRPSPGCWGRRVAKLDAGVFGTQAAIERTPRRWVARAHEEANSPESAWERSHALDVAARAPFFALVSLVAAGIGLGLMPRVLARPHPQLIELPEFRPRVGGLERSVWALTHPDLRKNARVLAVMNALAKAFDSVKQPVERNS